MGKDQHFQTNGKAASPPELAGECVVILSPRGNRVAAAQLTTLTQIKVAVARICLGTFSLRSGLGFSQSRFGVRDEGGCWGLLPLLAA